MEYPQRKHPRLKTYDYSQNGFYYVTICTRDKRCILGRVGTSAPDNIPTVYLSTAGKTVQKYIDRVHAVYPQVDIDLYVIMPNHVHMILVLDPTDGDGGLRAGRPTVPTVVRSIKSMVSRELGASIWQPSFYEHVIRNQESYEEIYRYISGNPGKWLAVEQFPKGEPL